MKINDLIDLAFKAKENAYAPYSNFKVGAVLIVKDGRKFIGCNVENASYGLSMCAERVALFKAVSEKCRDFESLILVSDSEEFCFPCGACRQALWEFGCDLEIIVVNKKKEIKKAKIRDLLPEAFSSHKEGNPVFGSKSC
ncbi:cytidine deaminase [Candidatus Oleimmundimicrobium sp.]|uniref:cytidine deaminase n=1 Tax=Candidatus Oleimmundimicrobium sp. TaxID=3060597 RepID=UPI00271EA044|nr:cytidine deaminase [Candidatus Oleimmundimicrobium sp.]MDO8885841.1 cytidine deaminase [Candidatus Oleimmundimicrobium sp.]